MKKHDIKLIDGQFESSDAKNLLLELLFQKINYHRNRRLSNEERFGKDREHSEKRIKSLLEEKEKLVLWLKELDENQSITIHATVHLEIK